MQGSTLTINFESAENIVDKFNNQINAYFVLSCEG